MNSKLARQILDIVESSPKNFDMSSWIGTVNIPLSSEDDVTTCGTTMCIAGWAAHLSGWDFNVTRQDFLDSRDEPYWSYSTEELNEIQCSLVRHHLTGEIKNVEFVARDLLDIPQSEAHSLFYTYNRDRAKAALRQIAENGENMLYIDWEAIDGEF